MSPTKEEKKHILKRDQLDNEKKLFYYSGQFDVSETGSKYSTHEFTESIRESKHATSDFETLIHLLKGNIGTGCLAMPQAFMNIGLWAGLFGLPFIGIISIYCMHLLLQSSRELCRRSRKETLNYEQTAEMSFYFGPQKFRPWSRRFYYVVETFLTVTQIGFCCVYLVFVSQNLYQAIECISDGTNLEPIHYMAIVVLPLILICFLPNLKLLAPVSTIAMTLQFIGILITLYYLVRDLPSVEMQVPAFAGFEKLPLFFGTTMYTFEGINLILPLENNMRYPDHFPGWNGVLNSGMTLVVCIYVAIGFYGYLRYGDNVLGSITLNLPVHETLSQSVKILFASAVFMSYPLQYYVPVSMLLPCIRERFSSERTKFIAEYLFRAGVVLLTFILAASIPNIALFTNLIGTICSSTLVLIFPPLISTATMWPHTGTFHWKMITNALISCFGIFGFATGAYASVLDIIQFYKSDDQGIPTC